MKPHGLSHAPGTAEPPRDWRYLLTLSLGALGVVYGDIGTSPLYALRECFHGTHKIEPSPDNILGVLSLIFWSLVLVISVKYLALIMRADNKGEGGILALLALVLPNGTSIRSGWVAWWLVILGLFGSALLYGDGVITPAISVLSAMEGFEVVTPALKPYVLPLTVLILVGLFAVQSHGTERVGFLFGPLMIVWFLTLAFLGIAAMLHHPTVLAAVHPGYAVSFFLHEGWHGFLILGIVFLVVTGGEALYADMGHFGKLPIRLAWFAVVLPGLLLNYFGQGALLLEDPKLASHPFFLMAPGWALVPLVLLATAATCVASQAVISGAFSLTMQAVQLGYLPRLEIRHTSDTEYGQIYIPIVNWLLFLATIWLVVTFRTSSALASAYGIAVTTTMVITTILAYFAMRKLWNWNLPLSLAVTAFFLVIDLSFFGANVIKVLDGGWFPLAVGFGMLAVMTTWRRGRIILAARMAETSLSLQEFFRRLAEDNPPRPKGTEIHMFSHPTGAPRTLLTNYRHNHTLHQMVVIVTVQSERQPYVDPLERITVEHLEQGFHRVIMRYGFNETPNVPWSLKMCGDHGLHIDLDDVTYFLGRETLIATKRPGMAPWREHLFAFLSRNASRPTKYFHIPPNQVLEIGDQIEL